MKFLHKLSDIKDKKILFLNLDGTVIDTISGKSFPTDETDFRIKKDLLDAIIKERGIEYIFVVSNQSNIGKFGVTKQGFEAKFESVLEFVRLYVNNQRQKKGKVVVDGLFCTAQGYQAKNKKPNTGMLEHCIKHHSLETVANAKMLFVGKSSGIHNETRDDFSDRDFRTAKNFDIDYMDVVEFINIHKNGQNQNSK